MNWILQHLKGTIDVGLMYSNISQSCDLNGYSDSDFAGDLDHIRSLFGYVFTLSNCAISYKTTLHSTVAFSTTETKYMAIVEATKEAIWLRGLLSDLGLDQ